MKLRLTKTNKVVFALLIVVLSSALGFLVWRVYQEEPLTSIESEAVSDELCPGNPTYVFELEKTKVCGADCIVVDAEDENPCPGTRTFNIPVPQEGLYTIIGLVGRGHYYSEIENQCQCQNCEDFFLEVNGVAGPVAWDPSILSTTGKDCTVTAKRTCSAPTGECPPPEAIAVQELGEFTFGSSTDIKMISKAPGCTSTERYSANSVQLVKVCIYSQQICGDSILDEKEECDPPESACTVDGKTGTCSDTCTCEVCGNNIVEEGEECDPPGSSCTVNGNTGSCSSECKCSVTPSCGDRNLDPNEQCEDGDPSGVQCTWSACDQDACTCLPAGLNISKSVVESCIGEGTENPVSELTYTVKVQNTGQGIGRVKTIEDVLDSKVSSSPSAITSPGQYSPGQYSSDKIIWDFTSSPLEIDANSTKTYTYKLSIDKDSFGTYNNTVTLTPVQGDPVQATASIVADCEILVPPPPEEPEPEPEPEEPQPEETIPETGVFDSTLARVGVGIFLVVIGYIVYIIPNTRIFLIGKSTSKRVRSKFEQKVLKKDS